MRLRLFLPTRIALECEVAKVVAEGGEGHFGILPRRQDFVSALVPGIVAYVDAQGREAYIAIDEGILVKVADEIMISTRQAVPGTDLASLERVVEESFLRLDERERSARSALARLEAGVVRRFHEMRERR